MTMGTKGANATPASMPATAVATNAHCQLHTPCNREFDLCSSRELQTVLAFATPTGAVRKVKGPLARRGTKERRQEKVRIARDCQHQCSNQLQNATELYETVGWRMKHFGNKDPHEEKGSVIPQRKFMRPLCTV